MATHRLLAAFLIVPVVSAAVVSGGFTLVDCIDTGWEALRRCLDPLVFWLVAGLPVAYLVEILIGIPAFAIAKRFQALSSSVVTGGSTAIGAVISVPTALALPNGPHSGWVFIPIFLFAGCVSGGTFWRIAKADFESAPGGTGLRT